MSGAGPGTWAQEHGPLQHQVWLDPDAAPAFDPARALVLARGQGRSYSDVCVNPGGTLLMTERCNRILSFDEGTGRMEVEGGTTLAAVAARALPTGWFPAVVPGTAWVSVGGAIANDIHGKNHHVAGSFCAHVDALALARSDGKVLDCSRDRAADWFAATAGGLGLTGVITRATLRLTRVPGPWLETRAIRFADLDGGCALFDAFDAEWPYTVAWLDASRGPRSPGRGWFLAGRFTADGPRTLPPAPAAPRDIPWPTVRCVHPLPLRCVNAAYFRLPRAAAGTADPWRFFFPLDGVGRTPRLYGRRGLFQHQGVAAGMEVLRAWWRAACALPHPPVLCVLKRFGGQAPEGLLSFARPGWTLALDVPAQPGMAEALRALDRIVLEAGGALYPAKDARMDAAAFRSSFPRWQDLIRFRDPAISSGFARRVLEAAP